MPTKVLVVGKGGREHAIAWRLSRDNDVKVFCAPGNPGTAAEENIENIPIAADNFQALADFAIQQNIDYTVVGPEAPLAAGISDFFAKQQLKCFGPSRAAAQLESSKVFCKEFLSRHHIPTAPCRFFTAIDEALSWLRQRPLPVVIKADGLAAGKGVTVATTLQEAEAAVTAMLSDRVFGDAGNRIIIEDYLVGDELSFIAIVSGTEVLPLAASQDHKARDDGDRGPNTGGMGAFSPVPLASPALQQRIMEQVIRPAVEGLAEEGIFYRGFLYAGLMIDATGTPMMLEFNCRLGDPETQPLLMRMQGDFNRVLQSSFEQKLQNDAISWDPRTALGVVLAAAGYPTGKTGTETIQIAEQLPEQVKVFHSGTDRVEDRLVTAGGRILCVTALGDDIADARKHAYSACENIDWRGKFYRSDIGLRKQLSRG